MKLNRILILVIIIIALATFFVWKTNASDEKKPEKTAPPPVKETTFIKQLTIDDGSTYGILMTNASVSPEISTAIFDAAKEVYDLSNIRLGRTLDLIYDKKTNELEQLVYQIDSEEKLYIKKQGSGTTTSWLAEKLLIPYEIKIKTVSGIIKTSMYEAALEQGIDERAIIAFADVFQWEVDFAWEVRVDDNFKFIYEERYLNGEYIMPGRILAGKFINQDSDLYAFYYEGSGYEGYYNEEAESVQKIFLKAPLAFKYITSGFTTGLRYISAFNISTGHRAIDYAAAYGTPVRAVGDGTVTLAGWDGSYGNKVSIRHNSTYSTNYAHLSRIAVKRGQKVEQGQTIGYVGSTGLSTGPHLHYELVKYGAKINPLTEEFPSTEGIAEENKQDFLEKIKDLKNQLDF